MNKRLSEVENFLKGPRGIRLITAVGVAGMLALILSAMWPQGSGATDTKTADTASADYAASLERQLGETVSKIEGAGPCHVMVTLENGVEYVYASEEKVGLNRSTEGERETQKDDSESSIIVISTDNGDRGLLVTEIQPTVKGVLVVCAGGGDREVQERIRQAVTTVLNITAKRVCVVAGDGTAAD